MGSMIHGSPASPFELEHLEFLRWSRQYQLHHEMQLPDTQPWHRLIARHDENPGRFDLGHPHIGRWIEQQESIQIPSPTLLGFPPHVIGDPGLGSTVQPSPPIGEPLSPSTVPEPSSLILLSVAMLAIWFLLPFMRRKGGTRWMRRRETPFSMNGSTRCCGIVTYLKCHWCQFCFR
jgi:hypothetical protein